MMPLPLQNIKSFLKTNNGIIYSIHSLICIQIWGLIKIMVCLCSGMLQKMVFYVFSLLNYVSEYLFIVCRLKTFGILECNADL